MAATAYGSVRFNLGPSPSISSAATPAPSSGVAFDVNPGPQSGAGAYGAVPGPIGIPPNYWQQMQSIYPVVNQANQAAGVIGKQLAGELTPEEISFYRTNAAQFGAAKGSPLSDFSGRYGLMSAGRKVSDTQQQGIQNYEAMLKALSGTLTPQELAAQIASRNAAMKAAPDPQKSAEKQMEDWQRKFQMAQNAARNAQSRQQPFYQAPTSFPNIGRPETGGGIEPTYNFPRYGSPTELPGALDRWRSTQGTYGPPGTGETYFDFGDLYDIPPGSYAQSDMYGNQTYTMPDNWWISGEDYYPDNTYYNPVTDTSNYDYGLNQYGWDMSNLGYYPEDTYYNAATDTSNYDYGLGDYGWDVGADTGGGYSWEDLYTPEWGYYGE